MKIFLIGLALFFIGGTLLPLLSHDHWTVRIFDLPRAQIAAAGPLIAGMYVAFWNTGSLFQDGVLVGLMGCALYQVYNTFHADYPFFRYSLDHAFHSEHFKVVTLERNADAAAEAQAQREIDKLAEKSASDSG